MPTADQMSAFKFALAHNDMYVEFSIFGPHGTRLKRRMKLSEYTVNREGKNTLIEVVGPPDIDCYLQSAAVMHTMIEMFNCIDRITWVLYVERIERYAKRYTDKCWCLLYQTDTRARGEHAPRIFQEQAMSYDNHIRGG